MADDFPPVRRARDHGVVPEGLGRRHQSEPREELLRLLEDVQRRVALRTTHENQAAMNSPAQVLGLGTGLSPDRY